MSSSDSKDCDILKKCLKITNYLRHNPNCDISALADTFGVSWPTMKANFMMLYEQGFLVGDESKPKKHRINPKYGYMLGISIGATETKVALIDFTFNQVNWLEKPFDSLYNEICELANVNESITKRSDYICFQTEHSFLSIRNICSAIVKMVYDFSKNQDINLMSVGVALPGIVDKDSHKMIFCPNIPELLNINVMKILSEPISACLMDDNISFYISHDSIATTVYEKEWTYKQALLNSTDIVSRNMAVIYMGSGLASGYILENRLLLGTTGTGEIGHLDLQYTDLPLEVHEDKRYVLSKSKNTQEPVDSDSVICMCGKKNCLEKLIRTKVFNSVTMSDFLDKIDADSLVTFKKDNPYRYRVLCHFISQLLNITINMLNVDRIVLTGRVFNGIKELKEDIEGLKIHSSLGCFSEDCEISFGSTRPDTVAIGAAILSYYCIFNDNERDLPIEW